MSLQSQKAHLTDMTTCVSCYKRFKNQGAIVRLTNGHVLHLSCYEKLNN